MTAPDQRAVPPPPPVADIWGAALADGSGRHVPVRRHWPELAAALDAEVDAAGMVPATGQADDPLRLRWEVQQLQGIVQDQHRAIAAVRSLCADAMKLPTLEDPRPADDRVSPRTVLAALDRAGSGPDTGQARADRLADGIRRFADDCKLLLDYGGLDNRVARSIAQQERNLRALLAEPSGDTDPLRASGRRFCEGDCSCGHDHERHGPEVPGCIECSCRITPEARQ